MFVRLTLPLLTLALLLPPLSAAAQLPSDSAARSSQEESAGPWSHYSAAVDAARGRLVDALDRAKADYDTVRAVFDEASAGLSEERRAELASSGPLVEARQAYLSQRNDARTNFKNAIEAAARNYGDGGASVFAGALDELRAVHAALDVYEAVSRAIESDQGAATESLRRREDAVQAIWSAHGAAIDVLERESERQILPCADGEQAPAGRARRLRCCKGCGIGTRFSLGDEDEESAVEAALSAALAAADTRLEFRLAASEIERASAQVTARETTIVSSDEELAEVELAVVSGTATAIAAIDLEGLVGIGRAASRAAVAEALSAYAAGADVATTRTSILSARAALEEAGRIYEAAAPVSIGRTLEIVRSARNDYIVEYVAANEKFATFDDRLDAELEAALEAADALRKQRRRAAAKNEAWDRYWALWEAARGPAQEAHRIALEANRGAFRAAMRAVREEAESHQQAGETARTAIHSIREDLGTAVDALQGSLDDRRARLGSLEADVLARVSSAAAN